MNLTWLDEIAEQCDTCSIALFVKQDSGPRPGSQGRIPNEMWMRKQFPEEQVAIARDWLVEAPNRR